MKLFVGLGGTAFVNVSLTLSMIFLFVAMVTVQPPHGHGMILASVSHPILMPHAIREDAMIIAVARDHDVFFGNTRVETDALPDLIRERLSRGSERKVYIRADPRVPYIVVKQVLDSIRSSGVERVGFLVEQRRRNPSNWNDSVGQPFFRHLQ